MTAALPDACSVQWETEHLPAAGSAPRARFWVALEQNGPWGHDAIARSHLPPEIGSALERAAASAGGRLLLIRHPGRHSDLHHPGEPVHVLVAGGPPHDPWLLEGELDDPSMLLRLPWPLLLRDDPDAVTEPLPQLEATRTPHLLVCTNGKRDVCCAVRGRPVVLDVAAHFPRQVWECSHTGGHRFSPTGVLLPFGQVLARLTPTLAAQALTAARDGELAPSLNNVMHNRGRSVWDPPGQAAEAAVRESTGEAGLAALQVAVDGDAPPRAGCTTAYLVTHRDGRHWRAVVSERPGPELKASCAKLPRPSSTWSVRLT